MRVLGIDPGLSRCGVAVVEGSVARPVARRAGVVRTDPQEPLGRRLAALHDQLAAVLREERPDAVAIERVFFNVNANATTGIGVAQAAGVAHLVAALAGIEAVEYTPSQVKGTVSGSGDADKDQVGFMVRATLRLAEVPRPADVADALALALCHLQHAGGHAGGAPGVGAGRLSAAAGSAGAGLAILRRAGQGTP